MLKKIIAGAALVAVIGMIASAAYLLGTESAPSDGAPVVADAPSGPSEGITVHGDWTLEVIDSDGTTAKVSQFKNALTSLGADRLSGILGRVAGVGDWTIFLTPGLGGTGACLTSSGSATACTISEYPFSSNLPNNFVNLTVDAPTSGTNDHMLVLSGNVVATNDGTIGQVATFMRDCPATIAPSNLQAECTTNLNQGFSSTTLTGDDIVSVVSGQSVNVTVVFSFQ